MSAFPLTLERLALSRLSSGVTAGVVLESLRARRQESGKGNLALRLGGEEAPEAPESGDGLATLLLPGAVVELSALPGAGALTLALRLLAEARQRAAAEGRPAWLCAVDSTRTLHAPAVAALGVELDKLVVMQPPADRLLRTAVRAARSGAFAGLLVDASGLADVSDLVTGVRRLTLAAEESQAVGVIVTSSRARRGLPLPVAARALVESAPPPCSGDGGSGRAGDDLHVRFLRHRHGPMPRLVLPRVQPRMQPRTASGAGSGGR